jgi:hypothetical protein
MEFPAKKGKQDNTDIGPPCLLFPREIASDPAKLDLCWPTQI